MDTIIDSLVQFLQYTGFASMTFKHLVMICIGIAFITMAIKKDWARFTGGLDLFLFSCMALSVCLNRERFNLFRTENYPKIAEDIKQYLFYIYFFMRL